MRQAVADFLELIAAGVAPTAVAYGGEPPELVPADGLLFISEESAENEAWMNGGYLHSLDLAIAAVMPQSADADTAALDLLRDAHDAAPEGTRLGATGVVEAWGTARLERERVENGASLTIARSSARLVWTSTSALE